MSPQERRALIKSRLPENRPFTPREVDEILARFEAAEIARGSAIYARRVAEFEAAKRVSALPPSPSKPASG